MKNLLAKKWKENRSFLIFLAFMFVFRSAIADWNVVPSGSMKPTIVEGDRIFVNKMAYDIRIPFTHVSLYNLSDPERGDIIVFDSKKSGNRLVKRVAGIPGDIVEMRQNALYINGKQLTYKTVSSNQSTIDKYEDLTGVKYQIRVSKSGSSLSSFPPVLVPHDHFLALGDNRDNSADSRVIGFIPKHEIVGRAQSVVLSLNYNNFYLPRVDRFFHAL